MIGDEECAQEAARLIGERDRRYKLFPAEIFDEFPWNMLLHLFISLERNEVMPQARLFELSHAPANVGRHWIKHLVSDGQIEAGEAGADIVLTKDAVDRLRQYLRPMVDTTTTSADQG